MTYRLTDATGRQLVFDRIPERVVSLIPSITESLFELGLGDRVAGISKYCIYPEKYVDTKLKVGGQKNPDFEKIEEIKPDLIILNREENKPEHIELLARKYPVWVTYPRKYFDTLNLLEELGGIFDVSVESYRMEIRRAPDALQKNVRHRVLYLIWRKPWMSINHDTFIHDVLSLHGLDNVFADHSDRYFEVSAAEILEADPDVIILPDEPYRFLEKHKSDFQDLPVQAVQKGRLALVDGTYFCWYGTRTARTTRYIKDHLLSRLS